MQSKSGLANLVHVKLYCREVASFIASFITSFIALRDAMGCKSSSLMPWLQVVTCKIKIVDRIVGRAKLYQITHNFVLRLFGNRVTLFLLPIALITLHCGH